MHRKPVFVLSLCLLTLSTWYGGFSAVEVKAANNYPVHNLDTGLSYASIQEAINSPETSNGHTIFVYAGTYCEHVVVNKTISLVGEDRDRTIIDGNGSLATILIASGGVSVSGFTVMNSYGEEGQGGGGLVLLGVSNVQISDVTACNNDADWGVHLVPGSHDINITRVIIMNNSRGGLLLNEAWKVNVCNNTIANNTGAGIGIYHGHNSNISGNNITKNLLGICCVNSSILDVHWNDICGNDNSNIETDELSATIDAIYNYWGNDPSTRKIFGNVLYNPWLTESVFPFALAIQSPQNGITVGEALVVKIQTSDLGNISRIEFFLQDVLVYTTDEKPYQWTWDTTKYPNGEYALIVKAYDNVGNVKTSKTTVTVKNVESPWWQTHFWTIIQALVAVGGLMLGIITYLTGKKKKRTDRRHTLRSGG